MKKGDKVIIFEDPLTCTKVEEKAILKKYAETYGDGIEGWMVMFPGEKEEYFRLINPENVHTW